MRPPAPYRWKSTRCNQIDLPPHHRWPAAWSAGPSCPGCFANTHKQNRNSSHYHHLYTRPPTPRHQRSTRCNQTSHPHQHHWPSTWPAGSSCPGHHANTHRRNLYPYHFHHLYRHPPAPCRQRSTRCNQTHHPPQRHWPSTWPAGSSCPGHPANTHRRNRNLY